MIAVMVPRRGVPLGMMSVPGHAVISASGLHGVVQGVRNGDDGGHGLHLVAKDDERQFGTCIMASISTQS